MLTNNSNILKNYVFSFFKISCFYSLFFILNFHSSLLAKEPKKNKVFNMSEYIEESIKTAANRAGIPAKLLKAICQAESGLNPKAFSKNDGPGSNNHAFGLCQVLRTTAEKVAKSKDSQCLNDFSQIKAKDRNYKKCKWFGPLTNATVAALFLRDKINYYNGDVEKAIAAYNFGHVKYKKGKKNKVFINQSYVNKVTKFLKDDEFEDMRWEIFMKHATKLTLSP